MPRQNCRFFVGKFPQILATITSTIGAVSDGMHYGWTAPVLPILRNSSTTPIDINETDEFWLENIYIIGGIFGVPLTIYGVDRFGRKPTILLSAVLHLTSWILIAIANSVEYIYVARFIAGTAGDFAFVSVPMYIGEISDQQIRGALSGTIFTMMLVGLVVVYSAAPFLSIVQSSMIAAAFVTTQLLSFLWMPESPYYLLLKDKRDQALKSLQRLRSEADVTNEFEDILTAVKRQSTERGRPVDLLAVSSNRKAAIIILVLNGCQQLCGYCVMIMNLHTIIADAATILPPSSAGIIFATIMLISAGTATLLVDKIGRRVLLGSSSLLSGVSLLTLAVYLSLKDWGIDVTHYNWVPVLAVMLYAAVFKCGVGLVPIIMTAELFPTSVKAIGMTISDVSYIVFSLVTITIYNQLMSNFGMQWPFFVFAAFCMFVFIFTVLCVPETKGRTLEEIQQILKGKKPADIDINRKRQQDTENI